MQTCDAMSPGSDIVVLLVPEAGVLESRENYSIFGLNIIVCPNARESIPNDPDVIYHQVITSHWRQFWDTSSPKLIIWGWDFPCQPAGQKWGSTLHWEISPQGVWHSWLGMTILITSTSSFIWFIIRPCILLSFLPPQWCLLYQFNKGFFKDASYFKWPSEFSNKCKQTTVKIMSNISIFKSHFSYGT